jgi:CO dehydrogenase/acetyl-CoA synthase beta subunit
MLRVDGIGWVMREWRDEVRLGMIRLASASRVTGRASRSLVRGRVKEA